MGILNNIMRSSATRLIIFITTILIAVIIGLQMHWLNKTYSYEKKEFNTSIVKCIRGLYEDMDLADEPGANLNKLIENPDENTFIFRVYEVPPRDTLISAIMNEFDDFKVYTDCKVAGYDDSTKKYLYEAYLPTAASIHPVAINVDAPNFVKNYAFVYLNFPNRSSYILSNMSNWIFTIILYS